MLDHLRGMNYARFITATSAARKPSPIRTMGEMQGQRLSCPGGAFPATLGCVPLGTGGAHWAPSSMSSSRGGQSLCSQRRQLEGKARHRAFATVWRGSSPEAQPACPALGAHRGREAVDRGPSGRTERAGAVCRSLRVEWTGVQESRAEPGIHSKPG